MSYKNKSDRRQLTDISDKPIITPTPEGETAAMSNEKNDKSSETKERVYVYLGPSIKGVVNNGRIFRSTKENVLASIKKLAEAAGCIDKTNKIKSLLVVDTDVSSAMRKLKEGSNAMSEAYKALQNALKEE